MFVFLVLFLQTCNLKLSCAWWLIQTSCLTEHAWVNMRICQQITGSVHINVITLKMWGYIKIINLPFENHFGFVRKRLGQKENDCFWIKIIGAEWKIYWCWKNKNCVKTEENNRNEWINLFSIFYINEKNRWLPEKPSHRPIQLATHASLIT